MTEPLPERYVFRARYTVAWPIWAGGYPTQEHALSTFGEHASELTAEMRAGLPSSFGKQFEMELSWRAKGYQPISGLSPQSSVPNSVELTVAVISASTASVDRADHARVASVVHKLAVVIGVFVRQHMPGASRGANLYDVVMDWQAGPVLLAAAPPVPAPGPPVPAPGPPVPAPGPPVPAPRWPISVPSVFDARTWRIRPYRYALTLGQLRRLAGLPGNGGEDAIDTYYGWRNDRASAAVKGIGGAALSLLVAWLVPFLKNEYAKTPLWLVLGPPLLTIIALAVWSLIAVIRLNRIHASYVASAALLQTFR